MTTFKVQGVGPAVPVFVEADFFELDKAADAVRFFIHVPEAKPGRVRKVQVMAAYLPALKSWGPVPSEDDARSASPMNREPL